MDYIILSLVLGTKLRQIVISYNIGRPWCRNFQRRIEELPPDLQLDPDILVEIGMPTWHVNGYSDKCKANFSLSYMHGVGRTCSKNVETTWAQTNSLGTSIWEMGLGACHETLNDQLGGWNFWKIVGFHKLTPYISADHSGLIEAQVPCSSNVSRMPINA